MNVLVSQPKTQQSEVSIQVILLMTFLLAVICFDSAHYFVAHKQAEIKQGAVKKNTSIRDLDECWRQQELNLGKEEA